MNPKYNNNYKLNIFATICLNIIVGIISLGSTQLLIAQANTNNSLAEPLDDPLIPDPEIQRDLSPLEIRRIEQEITEINQQATNELALGNSELAFQLWFRELKLQRALGRETEVKALGIIGNIAWQQNRGIELREIAQRLINIETEAAAKGNIDSDFLTFIGLAYYQIKYIDRSVNIYEKLLQEARQQNNLVSEKKNLERLGQLYLAKFDYAPAALMYEELLARVENDLNIKKQSENRETYLIHLIEIYDRLKQPEAAIKNRKKLLDKYIAEGKITLVATVTIAMGNNYYNLEQAPLASQYYQEAYTLAQSLQQVALAAEALTQLARLYQQENQFQLAIAIYQQLIDIEQKNNNFYGLINAYDNLGNIYLEIAEYSKALESFESGLVIAKSFNYKIEYLNDKIQQLK